MKFLKYLLIIGLSTLLLLSCAELQKVVSEQTQEPTIKDVLSNEQIIEGLKDALTKGAGFAVDNLSIEDGYLGNNALKILLPKEAKPIYDKLEKVPLVDGILENAVVSVNRAAEDAATAAKPIFIQAIKEMTIQDGMALLQGSDSAATEYLKEKTMHKLYEAFKPKIEASLSKVYVGNLSAEGTYSKAIDTYNKASLNGFLWDIIANNSLAEHTTQKALDGLFAKVSEEEKAIRKDPIHRVTDILKRVFGWEF